ncbi:MAG: hypothetical protein M8467_13175 [Anaerolineae bacterium]|nr:hypothetical protein [Anaerolineae bacterium]
MSKGTYRKMTLVFLMAAVLIASSTVRLQGIASTTDAFQSPIVTPEPSTTPAPLSTAETQIALDYIAARESVPVEHLLVVNQHRREYDVLGKTFWYVKALDRKSRLFYTALVDLTDQAPAELQDVEQTNERALETRYGKLEAQLYEVLQTKGPDDELTVAAWFTPVDSEAILAQLRAKYPQVSLELPERPWVAVQDRSLSAKVEADYFQLLQEAHLAKQEDLARSLQAQGYTVRLHRGIPSLVAKLPKSAILEIAQRADVTGLYLIEGKLNLLLDKAIPTARGNVVWQRGIDGAAERIAIVEPGEVNLFHFQIDVKERRWAAGQIDHTHWFTGQGLQHPCRRRYR